MHTGGRAHTRARTHGRTAARTHTHTSQTHSHVGDFFGENAMLNRSHDTSALAAEYCDLLVRSLYMYFRVYVSAILKTLHNH